MNTQPESIPESYYVGQDIDWSAPWIDAVLWVELPFWLLVGNTSISVEVGGHEFEVAVHENYFELHVGVISDSKQNVLYRGPLKRIEETSTEIRDLARDKPDVPLMWRNAKLF